MQIASGLSANGLLQRPLVAGAAPVGKDGSALTPGEEHYMGDPQLLRDVLADDPLLLTAEEAAKLLGVSRTTVYTLIKVGELRPVHIGRSCRLSRAELQRYVNRLETF